MASTRCRADLRVNLAAPRPTPQLDELQICFNAQRFLEGLGPHWHMLPHAHGALLCCQQAQSLEIFHLELVNVGALYFRIELQQLLKIATGTNAPSCHPGNVDAHIQAALPVTPNARRGAWRLNNAALFRSFIDSGWNLPIPRAPGAFQLTEYQGDLTLRWASDAFQSGFLVPTHRIDEELQSALQAYEAQRAPATASLLSAASIGDARGAWLAMHISAAAAKRADLNTLRVLRVTHQRAVERGRQEIGTIVSLIGTSAALGDRERALALVPVLESRIGADLKLPSAAGWVGAHLRNLLIVAPSEHASRALHSVVTPAGGTKTLGSDFDEELFTPLPTELQSEENKLGLSPVERARLNTRLQTADEHANVRTARREPSFALARQAFSAEDDQSAWNLVQQAVANSELVENDDMGNMVLRLAGKFSEDLADALPALAAIHHDRVSPEIFARAAQQRAKKLIGLGRLTEALGVLNDALQHAPDSILLRVIHAEALGIARDPAAIAAWRRVVDDPNLEPWEAHRYRKELAAILKELDLNSSLLDELRALHLQDSGNVQLTQQLAGLLENRAALDEAIIVRSRHAASVAALRGYPSVALLVQAVKQDEISTLVGALAAAQAIHLAASIANPAAWLQRALLTLAERFDDPLILEYALSAADALGDVDATARLHTALHAPHSQSEPQPQLQMSPVTSANVIPPLVDTPHADETTSEDSIADVKTRAAFTRNYEHASKQRSTRIQPDRQEEYDEYEEDGNDADERHFVLDEAKLSALLESLHKLYPRTLRVEGEDELQSLSTALNRNRPSHERAELLGRRAVVLLSAGLASGAAQAWTGAMILQPNEPRALAGLSIARSLAGATAAAASTHEHFLEELEQRAEQNPDSVPEALLRIAALIS